MNTFNLEVSGNTCIHKLDPASSWDKWNTNADCTSPELSTVARSAFSVERIAEDRHEFGKSNQRDSQIEGELVFSCFPNYKDTKQLVKIGSGFVKCQSQAPDQFFFLAILLER